MNSIYTDLAMEAHEFASQNKNAPLDGVICREEKVEGFTMTRVEINNEAGEKETGKPQGTYLTLQIGMPWNEASDTFLRASRALSALLRELCLPFTHGGQPILIAGLGNSTITADAIGPTALSHVIVTRHIKEASPNLFRELGLFDIAALSPGVLSQTGIETSEIIRSMADRIKPSVVIAIDSLASRNLDRLATTIQLTDSGIAPGSGMGNRRIALNRSTVGVPVIAIGVPTVVNVETLLINVWENLRSSNPQLSLPPSESVFTHRESDYFVTPKDTDLIIGYLAKVIGYGINLAFHEQLDFDEMSALAN